MAVVQRHSSTSPSPPVSRPASEKEEEEKDGGEEQQQQPVKPYTIFTRRQKHLLTAIIGIASLISPLTANIYLPLLPLLQEQYAASAQAINLTLTLYVVVVAVFPAVFAPAADMHGRRPVAILTMLIYTLGGVGLAVNDFTARSYTALLLLRAVQALGASASASITYGVLSDVCIPAERGTMVGPAISASNVGIVLGPVLGGLIAWRSAGVGYIFVGLAVFGALNLVMVLLFMPETARNVVGDGSEGQRVRGHGVKAWVLLGPRWHPIRVDDGHPVDSGKTSGEEGVSSEDRAADAEIGQRKKRFQIPNPLQCLTIILNKDVALILWLASCNYAVWYSVTASWAQIYADMYHWPAWAVGLAYLPSATTIVIAGLLAGPWMNARYRKTAREEGLPPDAHHVDGFPIERARIREQWPIYAATHIGIAGLGWAINQHAHPAVLLAVQALTGHVQTALFFPFNTLLIDVLPDHPSTASAAASLVRSSLSGIGTAILQPLLDAIGVGWYYTLLALLVGILQGVGMVVALRWGQKWREERVRRERSSSSS